MAQRVQTIFTDDLDGSEAEGTVRFGLDGTDFEIDLNTAHAQELRKVVGKYSTAGRKVGNAIRSGRRGSRSGAATGPSISDVREWAKAQGLEVKDRGRVPAELVVKFQAATGG
jgi:hypothetical protein